MGTHPIFESDFDCLTEWCLPTIQTMIFIVTRYSDTVAMLMKSVRLFRAQTAHMTYKGFNGPVSLTYAIATAYCAADALDKYKRTGKVVGAVDAFAWQIAASVAIPGFVIHQTCKYSNLGLQQAMPKMTKTPRQFAVSLIGLAAIPFIIHPIDHAVDYIFDSVPRKYLYKL